MRIPLLLDLVAETFPDRVGVVCGDQQWTYGALHAATERLTRKLRIREQLGDAAEYPFPVWVWRAGDALFVGTPGEAYSDLQVTLRRSFPHHAVTVMNIVNEVGRVLVGQEPMVMRLLVGLLTGGHVLLEGVPGLAKTLAVRSLA